MPEVTVVMATSLCWTRSSSVLMTGPKSLTDPRTRLSDLKKLYTDLPGSRKQCLLELLLNSIVTSFAFLLNVLANAFTSISLICSACSFFFWEMKLLHISKVIVKIRDECWICAFRSINQRLVIEGCDSKIFVWISCLFCQPNRARYLQLGYSKIFSNPKSTKLVFLS